MSDKQVTLQDSNTFRIEFPYSMRKVMFVKKILPHPKFFRTDTAGWWTCNATKEAYLLIRQHCPEWEMSAEVVEKFKEAEEEVKEKPRKLLNSLDPRMYEYQKQGVLFLEQKNGMALIADEMGLGKTVQAAAWLESRTDLRPALVLCPATAKFIWKRELTKWCGGEIVLLSGRKVNRSWLAKDAVHIINYDILKDWVETLMALRIRIVVADESQMLKGMGNKRTKAFRKLMQKSFPNPNLVALSGTPIVNRPVEFFSILNILDPEHFAKFFPFAMRYCGAKHNGFGWQFNGATRMDELHELVFGKSGVGIRRLKKDVLTELPPKQIAIVPLEINNQDEYDDAEANVVNWIRITRGEKAAEKASKIEALAMINTLKMLAAQGKMKQVKEWIATFLESDEKLVVFAVHHEIIDLLMVEFAKIAVKIDGRDGQNAREKAITAFQNDGKVKLFIGNIKAAGTAITLTAASNLAFVELGWSPGDHSQATDRVHRISQTKQVTIYYLIAENTIEKWIAKLISEKQRVLDQVLEGEAPDEEGLLSSLISKLRGETNE